MSVPVVIYVAHLATPPVYNATVTTVDALPDLWVLSIPFLDSEAQAL